MNISTIIAIAVFLTSFLLSQKIGRDAIDKLDDSMKLEILKVFGKRNFNSSMGLFATLIIYLLALTLYPKWTLTIFIGFLILFFSYLIIKAFINMRKLKTMSAPEDYIKRIGLSHLVFILGLTAAIGIGVFAQWN